MASIVEKMARDLRPGDVLIVKAPKCRRTVVAVTASSNPGELRVQSVRLGYVPMEGRCDVFFAETPLTVEVPDLTPAQQHAEELVDLVRSAYAWGRMQTGPVPDWITPARNLLDDLRPEPPTLAEVLNVMQELIASTGGDHSLWVARKDAARDLLERARRAGVL